MEIRSTIPATNTALISDCYGGNDSDSDGECDSDTDNDTDIDRDIH